jgi:hypothetical protein
MASTAKRVKKRCIDALEDSKYYTLLNHLLGIPAGKKNNFEIHQETNKQRGRFNNWQSYCLNGSKKSLL